MRIDLHAHSTASDGTDTPSALIDAALRAQLDVLAVTDHDTTAGWDEAAAARPPGLTLVPGAEISCMHHAADGRRISMHVLAYLFDPDAPGLASALATLRTSRLERGRRMVHNMVADGVDVSWDGVVALAEGGSVGRPHIGRALVQAGLAPDVSTAFRTYLSSGSKYYVRKADLDVFEVLRLIDEAGGVSVFAHPLARRRGPVVADDVIREMAAAGLTGIEVEHADHDAEDRAHAARLADELDLVPTGSSDYHGSNKNVELGDHLTAVQAYERLISRPTARRPLG